ncbi:MAG: hypothetical protein U0Q15_07260 [Kineosporiaceae bacterium]
MSSIQVSRLRSRRGVALLAGVSAATLTLTGLAVVASLPTSALSPTVTWDQAGPDGGGVVTAIASDGQGTLIAGGDTMGLLRSTDNGDSWKPANLGLTSTDYAKVAAVLYVPAPGGSAAGRWYAAVGRGTLGAVLVSTDGMNWSRMLGATADTGRTLPAFMGANTDQTALAEPRSTGNLLASDGTWLYAGSYRDGVYRCRLDALAADRCVGGAAPEYWSRIGLAPTASTSVTDATVYRYIRSIALAPDGSRLYAATADLTIENSTGTVAAQQTGVAVLSSPSTATATSTWTAAVAPEGVEELKFVPATTPTGVQRFLYAVGARGVHRLISGSRATTTPTFEVVSTAGLSNDLRSTAVDPARIGQWSGIDGVATATGSRLVLTSQFMPETSSPYSGRRTGYLDVTETSGAPTAGTLQALDRTTDRSGLPPVNANVAGTTRPWDLLTARTVAAIGQKQYLGSSVFIAPAMGSTPSTVWIAGKQGLYRRPYSTGALTGNWDAAMNGLLTTFTYNLAREPGTGTRAIGWTDADLLVERTTGSVAEGKMCQPFGKAGVTAWGLQYQTDGTAWVATGDQTGSSYLSGQLWVGTTSGTGCTWNDTHLETITGGTLRKAPAFAVSGRGANTIVTAYMSNVGLVRGIGTPPNMPWRKLTSETLALRGGSPASNAEATKGVALVSLGQVVVLARPSTASTVNKAWGVDACYVTLATETAVCHPVMKDATTRLSSREFNYLAVDPVTPGRVFWSAAGEGVWSFDVNGVTAADTAPLSAVQDSSLVPGGPMTIGPNGPGQEQLVVAPGKPADVPSGSPMLWRRNLSTGTAWEPFNVAGGAAADDAIRRSSLPVTGVLVTNKGPAAGTWRIYLTSLGNGSVSGVLSGF